MALEDCKDFDPIAPNSVDHSIGAFEHLANVVATELRNAAPGHRRARCAFSSGQQHAYPPHSGRRIVSGNEVADRSEI
jgi:hypothetical protein